MDDMKELQRDMQLIKQDLSELKSMVSVLLGDRKDIPQKQIFTKPVEIIEQGSPCINCKTTLEPETKFCTICGTQQVEDSIPTTFVQPVVTKADKDIEPISFEDRPVSRADMMDGLKFNYRSLIKVSQSSSFTYLGLMLFLIAGLLNAASTVINLSVFGVLSGADEVVGMYNLLFFGYVAVIALLAFFIEFSLKNMKLRQTSIASSIRITGLLSIILLIRGVLSVIYNLYIYAVGVRGNAGIGYFAIFEGISWSITGIILMLYLIVYLKNRASVSEVFAFLLLVGNGFMAGFVFTLYGLPMFLSLFQIPLAAYIGAVVSVGMLVVVQIKK